MNEQVKILVTGATGYVGGRLVPRLLEAGYAVRIMVRDPARLVGRDWLDSVEVVRGDVLKPDTLPDALTGIHAAYYLIHSMSGHSDFEERDIIAARNFGTAAKHAAVERIIYLGGLGHPDEQLSTHLRSRQETGDTLRESGIPVTEFRAGVVVGSGSISFEMVRYLTERVPVLICPRWVFTKTQPIAVRDALNYLISALETPESTGKTLDIGIDAPISYKTMMMTYARLRGLRRFVVPVPVLTPRLSSYWVHFVTPIPSDIARPLIDGLRNESTVRDDSARRIFPQIQPMSYETAVSLALDRLNAENVETSWSDSLSSSQGDVTPVVLTTHEGMLIERRQHQVDASPEAIYRTVTGLGGQRGWMVYNWAWRLRGLMDSMVGGVGFRRGRRHKDELRAGEALDFWRVEALEENRMLRLRAEMKVPGRAWLQFRIEPLEDGSSRLTQTAFFAPKGLFGPIYWYSLYPIHGLIFSALIRKIGEAAEQADTSDATRQPATQP